MIRNITLFMLTILACAAWAQDEPTLPSFTAGKFKYEIVDAAQKWVQIAPKNGEAGGYGTLTQNDFVSQVTYNGDTYQVVGIGAYAFYGCTLNTGRILLPEGMLYIDDYAFEGAELGTLRLSSTVRYLSPYALAGNLFGDITAVPANPYFAFLNSDQEDRNFTVLTNKEQTTLLACPGAKAREFNSDGSTTYITSFTIPAQITEIGDCAFFGNKHLSRITFHSGITRLGMGAFSRCTALTGVNIPNPDCEIGNSCFEQCTTLTSVRLPQGMKRLGRHVFFYCTSLSSITLPEGMEEIGMMSLGSCNLSSVNLPSTMVKLDTCALQDNPFSSIDLKNVKWIGYQCFSMCSNLKTLTGNGQVERIDGLAFARCNAINNPAFLPDGLRTMEMNVFFRSTSFSSLTIPATVECMEGNPAYMSACKEYQVAEGNPYFMALDSCIYATTGRTTLPVGTVYDPWQPAEGAIPTALVGVPSARVNTELVVPEGVTTVCNQAARAVPLTEIHLPSTLTVVRKMAFTGISTLTQVTCLATVPPTMEESSFTGDAFSATLRVPIGSLEAYRTAPIWKNFQNIEGIDTGNEPVRGDLNGDGKVDVSDVNIAINIILGATASDEQQAASDLTGDGKTDVSDVNALINIILTKN
ncbi:MAG: leucine-rich repeat protein [Muribaculaceae bacterium]|nr:leucine-rich repeat protein [Muribaculaceae bacterium]